MTELQENRQREPSDWERDVEAWNLPSPALTTPAGRPTDLSNRSERQTEGEERAQSGSAGA
jgi:hypothetical protein